MGVVLYGRSIVVQFTIRNCLIACVTIENNLDRHTPYATKDTIACKLGATLAHWPVVQLTLTQLDFLRSPAAEPLLSMPLPGDALAAIGVLRKLCTPDQAAAVMTLRELRERAERTDRFPPPIARRLLASDKMLQQASSLRLSVYKGRRMMEVAGRTGAAPTILDLCCGLGADAIGLALAGADVRGYDRDEAAVLCATHNAAIAGLASRCRFHAADVTAIELSPESIVHADPDRRATGRRTVLLADYSPDEAFLRSLPARTRAGAIKLSPAMDWNVLADWPGVWAEYVSEAGVCKQLILWWGQRPALSAARLATVVWGDPADPQFLTLPAGLAPFAPLREPGEFLIEPDPAVIAAGAVDDLAGRHGLWRVDRQLAWLFGPDPLDTPLARSYRVLRRVTGRPRDVSRAIAELGGGTVEVKTRGLKLDTDRLQRSLRGPGDRPLVVAWCRIGPSQQVFLCQRGAGEVPNSEFQIPN